MTHIPAETGTWNNVSWIMAPVSLCVTGLRCIGLCFNTSLLNWWQFIQLHPISSLNLCHQSCSFLAFLFFMRCDGGFTSTELASVLCHLPWAIHAPAISMSFLADKIHLFQLLHLSPDVFTELLLTQYKWLITVRILQI